MLFPKLQLDLNELDLKPDGRFKNGKGRWELEELNSLKSWVHNNDHFSQNWLYNVVNASRVLLRQPMLIFNFPGGKNSLSSLLASKTFRK